MMSVFRRTIDEDGNIDKLRFMDAGIERYRIRMYVKFREDLWFNCIDLCLLLEFSVVPLHWCVFVFDFSGLGTDDNDYFEIPNDEGVRDTLFEALAGAGFARRKDQDEKKLLPCPKGTFVYSSATDHSKLVCLECPPGSCNILTTGQCYVTK